MPTCPASDTSSVSETLSAKGPGPRLGRYGDDNRLARVERNRGQHSGTEENRGESECDTGFHKISQRES